MPRFAANITFLFTELPFLDRFEAAARAGFRGVEFHYPYAVEPADIRQRLDAYGLTPVLMNIRAGDPVTFKVRSFRTTAGNETWDFGDGSEKVTVKSDGNVSSLAQDGYAVTQHRFARPGHYLVRVERTNEHGQRAIAHLHVPVEEEGREPAK